MTQRLGQPARLGGRLDVRSDDPVDARVEHRRGRPRVGEPHEGGAAGRASGDRERLDVSRAERAVLEVDPDEIERLGDQLGEGDVGKREHRAQQRLVAAQPVCESR